MRDKFTTGTFMPDSMISCRTLYKANGFSCTNNGCFVGHISPEAASGGPIALIEDGDRILIDVVERRIELLVSDEELERRSGRYSGINRQASFRRFSYVGLTSFPRHSKITSNGLCPKTGGHHEPCH